MVTFSSFLPLLILSCVYFLAFLQIFNLYISLEFLLSVHAALVFFCTVLQLFDLVLCFGDQVLSPGSSLATDFLGVVPLWRVEKKKIFPSPDCHIQVQIPFLSLLHILWPFQLHWASH